MGDRTRTEEFRVSGEEVLAKVKELVHEGNVRRIAIRSEQGETVVKFPLTGGVIGAVPVPMWAAIGPAATLLARCTTVVERVESGQGSS